MRSVVRSPLFWGVLALKLGVGALATSYYLSDLFIPFANYFVESGFADPWKYFFDLGRTNAFPYGPVMLYPLALFRGLFHLFLPSGTFAVSQLHLVVARLPTMIADIGMLLILTNWFPQNRTKTLLLYWANPILFFVGYWHGQLDLIPTSLMLWSVHQLKNRRYTAALLIYGAAAAGKLHVLVVAPILVSYLVQKIGYRRTARAFLGFAGSFGILLLPYAFRPEFIRMVFDTAESSRLFELQVVFGKVNRLLLGPAILAFLCVRFSLYAKRNWDLFMLYAGILFSSFLLVSVPSPGYYSWSIPFIIYFLLRTELVPVHLFLAYSASFLVLVFSAGSSFHGPVASIWPGPLASFVANLSINTYFPPLVENVAFSGVFVFLVGMIYQMYQYGVRSNEVYRIAHRSISIGISGDSGAGKDELAKRLDAVLGTGKATIVSGDNYHRWARGDKRWASHTHLDANANHLHSQYQQLTELLRGNEIVSRVYDHDTGQFTEGQKIRASRYVMIVGLHSFLLEQQARILDLRIFVEPDEALRVDWKVARDSHKRGASRESVLKTVRLRKPDRNKFVEPQKEICDVIVSYRRETSAKSKESATPQTVTIRARNRYNLEPLVQAIRESSNLEVVHGFEDHLWQSLTFTGYVAADILTKVAQGLMPNLEELSSAPRFDSGINGGVQLVLLFLLSENLRAFSRASDRLPAPAPNVETLRRVG